MNRALSTNDRFSISEADCANLWHHLVLLTILEVIACASWLAGKCIRNYGKCGKQYVDVVSREVWLAKRGWGSVNLPDAVRRRPIKMKLFAISGKRK